MDIKEKRQFLIRSLESEAFTTTAGLAQNVNPTLWENRLRESQKEMLVLVPFAERQPFQNAQDLNVTIEELAPAIEEVAETETSPVAEILTRQVTHNPTEYSLTYQLTKKQSRRGFFNAINVAVSRLSTGSARRKDLVAANTLYAGASTTIFANGASDRASLTDSDEFKLKDILRARAVIQANRYVPTTLFVSHAAEAQLLDATKVTADKFGTTRAIQDGFIGRLHGVNVIRSDSVQIVEDGAVSKNIMIGTTRNGESCFGHGILAEAELDREYHARDRYWDIVVQEDYDFLVYHPDAIVVIESHNSDYVVEMSS